MGSHRAREIRRLRAAGHEGRPRRVDGHAAGVVAVVARPAQEGGIDRRAAVRRELQNEDVLRAVGYLPARLSISATIWRSDHLSHTSA